jgi:ATP synthase subunit 6
MTLFTNLFVAANYQTVLTTPVEQFDNVSWTFETIWASPRALALDVLPLEIDFTEWSARFLPPISGGLISLFGSLLGAAILYFPFVAFFRALALQNFKFSFVALLLVILLRTGPFVIWFNDFPFATKGGRLNIEYPTHFVSRPWSARLSFDTSAVFAFAPDELFFTLIAIMVLWPSEPAEDFIIGSEGFEADVVEPVVSSIFLDNLGKDVHPAFYLQLCSIFGLILANNFIGRVPFSDTATAGFILTFFVTLAIFVSLLVQIFRHRGVAHFFSLFLPGGVQFVRAFLIVPIEFVSYGFRIVTLSARLFANRRSGHTLLKVFVGFSIAIGAAGGPFLIGKLVIRLFIFALVGLELRVAAIQAFIFTILAATYLKDIYAGH